jgi:hypothetical protein
MTEVTIGHVFTPRLSDGSRLDLRISDADHQKITRGQQWNATVVDLNTGHSYCVAGADCGLSGCLCDAVVVDMR